eukprot:Skav206696  [mRNA]  locus=scaffold99:17529:21803:+ [translate_table: standard]
MDCKHLNPRRRRRLKFNRAKHDLLVLVICSLNFEVLGFPKRAPPNAQLGAHISSQQHAVIERIDRTLSHFMQMSPWSADDLGRAREKFEMLINQIQELPKCTLGLEDLTEFLTHMHGSFDPYSTHFARVPEESCPSDQHECTAAGQPLATEANFASAKPVIASRIKWENPPSFAARDYLDDPLLKAAFDDPETLRKPPELWSRVPPGKMHCTRAEFLRLAQKWDSLGACMLIPAELKDSSEAVGVFAVGKDVHHDRLIINPRTINSRMFSISQSTKELAPGCLLGLLHLDDHEMFRFCADDLSDFYFTFHVSEARGSRNAFKYIFDGSELRGFSCYDPTLDGHKVRICLRTLAMGDNLAVEIAQQAHSNVLKFLCGAMVSKETLRYRHPIPRTSYIEMLAIDDHIGLQKLAIRDYPSNPTLRDTKVFKAAESAYSRVGLVQHERKRKRNETKGILLGADFDGLAGVVMAPRNRIIMLSIITLSVVNQGTCTPKLLSVLVGCWIHVLMFRRALFAVFDQVFKESQGVQGNNTFCLSRKARSELQLISCLAPLAQSNMRASYASKLYSTDASPEGGAITFTDISSSMCQELWRHTEQRGFYTKLLSPVSEILYEKGLSIEAEKLPPHNAPDLGKIESHFTCSVPPPLSEGILFDCVELFRGTGGWSQAHKALGLVVHDGFDVDSRRLRVGDIHSNSVCHELIGLALRKVVRTWHAGVPCLTFGTLRRPQLRSKEHPAGFDPTESLTAYHNSLARRTAFILTIAVMLGQFISVEQPGGSRLFLLHCYKVLISLGCVISHFRFCSYGSALEKHSKWLHNQPWLVPLESKCTCAYKNNHFVVQGNFTTESIADFNHRCRPSAAAVYGRMPRVGESVATYSGAYPFELVRRMASGMVAMIQGQRLPMPDAVRIRSLAEVGLDPEASGVNWVANEPGFPSRPWHEDPQWISEICNSLSFKLLFRYQFKRRGHINVNETRVYKSWMKAMAKTNPDSRFVGLLDSRVTIGSAAKGRSSSYSISRILQGSLAYVLGSGLYPGCLHCYSGDNRSDGPSRMKPIEGPRFQPPQWLKELLQGDAAKFDMVAESARVPRNPARWIRFLLMLCGDIHPNPGPRVPRGPMDLSVGFAQVTSDRMRRCVDAFKVWCAEHLQIKFEKLLSEPASLGWALRAYGLYCFEEGLPRYLFVYSITGLQELHPEARQYLAVAWQIDKKWQIHEPGQCRSVLPVSAIKACLCLAAMWGWHNWLGIVVIGFGAMLHPSEMVSLVRRDLVFPSDVGYDSPSLFIHVRDPKTARFARRQHGRIDDPDMIWIVYKLFGSLELDEKLYPASFTSFRKQWDAIMRQLGIPFRQSERGATPGVLRGSGATFLYSSSEDVSWVAWRGRWARVRTLEYYLQEVGAHLLVHSLDRVAKYKIEQLSAASWPVIRAALTE